MLTTIPQCNFSLEFLEILSQNYICYHSLSVSGISKIMHCGTLLNIPYFIHVPLKLIVAAYIGETSESLAVAMKSAWI